MSLGDIEGCPGPGEEHTTSQPGPALVRHWHVPGLYCKGAFFFSAARLLKITHREYVEFPALDNMSSIFEAFGIGSDDWQHGFHPHRRDENATVCSEGSFADVARKETLTDCFSWQLVFERILRGQSTSDLSSGCSSLPPLGPKLRSRMSE